MTCKDHGHHFIAQLLIAHGLAGLLITGEQEHREQIPQVLLGASALLDEARDYSIENGEGTRIALIARGGYPERQGDQRRQIMGEMLKGRRKRLSHRTGLELDIRAKQGFRHDLQRQAHHFSGEIKRLLMVFIRVPALNHRGSTGGHHGRQTSNALTMEGRLGQTTFSKPGCSLIEEQILPTKQRGEALESSAFVVVLCIDPEYMIDSLGIKTEIQKHRAKGPKTDHISIALSQLGDKAKLILLHLTQVASKKSTLRSWDALRGTGQRWYYSHRKILFLFFLKDGLVFILNDRFLYPCGEHTCTQASAPGRSLRFVRCGACHPSYQPDEADQ